MNHFTRLIELTSADEEYISKLATVLAPCILRPRQETSLTMEEKHAYRLVRDLFAYKDAIFNELKRLSTLNSSGTVKQRPRAISTDESNRKALVEERNRAIIEKASGSRSRATSPAPTPRTPHRRDRSIGGPENRFPIQPSISSPTTEHRKRGSLGPVLPKRTSLEVPSDDTMGFSHPADGNLGPANGSSASAGPSSITVPVPMPAPATDQQQQLQSASDSLADKRSSLPRSIASSEGFIEKRNSLSRSGARLSSGRRVTPAVSSATARTATPPPGHQPQGESQQGHTHGVTLVDAPMDY